MSYYLMSLGLEVWHSVLNEYIAPSTLPTDQDERKVYVENAKALNSITNGITYSEFTKVMDCNSAKGVTRMRVFVMRGHDFSACHARVRWAAGSPSEEASAMKAIKSLPPEGMSIQCSPSMKRFPDSNPSHFKMVKKDEQSFDCEMVQTPGEERFERTPICQKLSLLSVCLFLSVFAGKGKRSRRHGRRCNTKLPAWCVIQDFTGLNYPLTHSLIRMAPRYRASSRRGGQRSGAGRRGNRSPWRISPLNRASPSYIGTEDSGQSIYNRVQTARFQYRRSTNRPAISALITIIFEEEDGVEGSSEEHLPGSSDISSPSG